MNDLIQVPAFARLDDYIGLWSMLPDKFAGLWHYSQLIDWRAHMAEKIEPQALVEKQALAGGGAIAIVRLAGVLMKSQTSMGGTSTIQARRDIRQAAADPDVSAILLAIDSPGGTVAGTDDLATEVRNARKQKTVWAHVDDLCASAAYWVASQAERITVNSPTALVGSIGTMQVVRDSSEADKMAGIRTLLFATGPLKGAGTPGVPVTDDQTAYFQDTISKSQEIFDAAVRSGRKLSAKELENVRSGAVFIAGDAQDRKLVDAIQPLAKTLSELSRGAPAERRRAELPNEPTGCLPTLERRGLPMLGV